MTLDPYGVVLHPYVTEKTMTKMEAEGENTLIFIVRRTATKSQIKWAVEKLFDVKVADVRTLITNRGEKQAIVRFAAGYSAEDVGMRIGIF